MLPSNASNKTSMDAEDIWGQQITESSQAHVPSWISILCCQCQNAGLDGPEVWLSMALILKILKKTKKKKKELNQLKKLEKNES